MVLARGRQVYSDQPINAVVRQTPTVRLADEGVSAGAVVLSLGQRHCRSPLLEGNSLRASRIELLRQGLQVARFTRLR